MTDEDFDYRVPEKEPYDLLPISIRAAVSRQQYKFMTDAQRANLLEDYTMPEPEADF